MGRQTRPRLGTHSCSAISGECIGRASSRAISGLSGATRRSSSQPIGSCNTSTTRRSERRLMRFRTTILQSGKTATGIRIPDEVVESLGAGRRPAVRVTIRGYTYRSTVAVMGDAYMVGVNADNRAAAGVKGGDEVDVEIELDTAPRTVEVPDDLAAALDAEPTARKTFDTLSNSNKSWHVLQVLGAKTDETRQRRIAKSIAALKDGRIR